MDSKFYYISLPSLGIVAALLGLVYFRRWNGSSGSRKLPPGPPCYVPILGHLPNLIFAGKSLHRYLAGLAREHGPIFSLSLGSSPAVVVSSPELAKAVLHTHGSTFADRPTYTSAKYLTGIEHSNPAISLLPYGESWRRGRKLYTTQLLSPHRLQLLHSDIISDEIHHLISTRLLHPPTAPGIGSAPAALVDLSACIDDLLENIVCRILLSQRPSEVMAAGSSSVTLSQLIKDLADLLLAPLISDFVPWLGFLDYKVKASMKKWRASFTTIIDHVLTEREKHGAESDDGGRADILDAFLLPENKLSRQSIQIYILELLTGGIDTSSSTLDWAMSELLANPRVLAKLRAELDGVVGSERWVDHSDIPHLPYMQAVVKETFRKHPPVPVLLPHMSSEACQVSGYTIPEGTRVFVNAWAIGHDPAVWRDPEAFMPERFLAPEHSGVDVKGHHFELLPFGSGKRMCPGLALGMTIVQLALSTLVHSLEWELPIAGQGLDMSEQLGALHCRAHPLLVLPPSSRLHISNVKDEYNMGQHDIRAHYLERKEQ